MYAQLKNTNYPYILVCVESIQKNFFVQTIIHTESGQFQFSADMGTYDNIQTVGSKITYLRRYLLQPMLNLEGDIDTDDDENVGQEADKPYANNKFGWYTWNGKEEINTSDIVLWSKKLENLLDYIKKKLIEQKVYQHFKPIKIL